jgi:predicted 3-demethylubiquinone-9 3-methyltransferase (glyoxalase superfamily)
MEAAMTGVVPNLWFDGRAEEAADFYTSLFPDSRIDSVMRAGAETPGNAEGDVIVVAFTLFGQRFAGINGGPRFPFTEAVSFAIECDGQAEVDRYWEALIADGGEPSRCGWLKDRFGLSWQVVPNELGRWLGGPDPDGSRKATEAMLSMEKLDIAAIRRAYEGAATDR